MAPLCTYRRDTHKDKNAIRKAKLGNYGTVCAADRKHVNFYMQMFVTKCNECTPLRFQALRLDNNRLEELNGLLNTQHHLQWLNVSHNLLQWFDYAFIPKSLLWLNLRNNRIEELGNYYDMQTGFRLVHLDVGGNRLQRIERESLVHSLKEVSD